MRRGLFLFLLISLLCLHFSPFCLSETNFTIKADDHYKHLKQERHRKGLQGSEQMNVGAVVARAGRTRGVYGAGSDVHHGRSKNDANPIRIKSTSSLLWKVSCGLFCFCLLLAGF